MGGWKDRGGWFDGWEEGGMERCMHACMHVLWWSWLFSHLFELHGLFNMSVFISPFIKRDNSSSIALFLWLLFAWSMIKEMCRAQKWLPQWSYSRKTEKKWCSSFQCNQFCFYKCISVNQHILCAFPAQQFLHGLPKQFFLSLALLNLSSGALGRGSLG